MLSDHLFIYVIACRKLQRNRADIYILIWYDNCILSYEQHQYQTLSLVLFYS
jgi:hypothetical protein